MTTTIPLSSGRRNLPSDLRGGALDIKSSVPKQPVMAIARGLYKLALMQGAK